MKYLLAALIISSLALTSFCVTKEMRRYELFCFYRDLPAGDHFSGSYVVSGFNELAMALQIFSPTNELLVKIEREREGNFYFDVNESGEYRACFRNLEKDLSYVTFEVSANKSESTSKVVDNKHINKVESTLEQALSELRNVFRNQRFEEMRLRVHHFNLEFLTSRIQWTTFFKVLALMCIGAGQAYVLTNFFKKKGQSKVRV